MKLSNKALSCLLALLLMIATVTGCEPQFKGSLSSSTATLEDPTEELFPSSPPCDTTGGAPSEDATDPSEDVTESSVPEDTTEAPAEETTAPKPVGSIVILKGSEMTLAVGDGIRLAISKSDSITETPIWSADGAFASVDATGYVCALAVGDVTVRVVAGEASDSILIHVIAKEAAEEKDGTLQTAPRDEVLAHAPNSEIYEAIHSSASYRPAQSRTEALERASNGELAGYDFVPEQAPILSAVRPMKDGKYLKNSVSHYADDHTYVVIDAYGREVFRVYRGGAYITLEEVAAYVYAFGTMPANHSASKKTKPNQSEFGKYLRVNHTKFSGDTSRYPYEPVLPRISGCGGDLTYWEMDVGTTGTDCDPSYDAALYNNGTSIVRGAARIVYTWNDLNGNGITDGTDVVYVFYTYNHYNDFCEYLNYYGGWGETFGNITGGGTISSKTDYNPTAYVPVLIAKLPKASAGAYCIAVVLPDWRTLEGIKKYF